MDDQQERAIGARLAASVEARSHVSKNRTVIEYVNNVGQKIVRLSDRPEIPYTFKVLSDTREVRAFALPGGHIYVTTGLLLGVETECQLAGVLSHEVGHVAMRDPANLLGKEVPDAQLGVILRGGPPDSAKAAVEAALAALDVGYGAAAERNVNRQALLYSARAGLNPAGLIQMIQRLAGSSETPDRFWEPLSGHQPTAAERVSELEGELKSMGLDAGLPSDPDRYAKVKAELP
jgi:predicted Zn-dependent protease